MSWLIEERTGNCGSSSRSSAAFPVAAAATGDGTWRNPSVGGIEVRSWACRPLCPLRTANGRFLVLEVKCVSAFAILDVRFGRGTVCFENAEYIYVFIYNSVEGLPPSDRVSKKKLVNKKKERDQEVLVCVKVEEEAFVQARRGFVCVSFSASLAF